MRTYHPSVRLEAHRLKRIRDHRLGPLIPFHELTEHEKQFLIDELSRDANVRRLNVSDFASEQEFDRMFLSVLDEWGVMCPHPIVSVEVTPVGYRCQICSCDLFPLRIPSGRARAKR
jgi:hypothetical protein